jgi:GNAT superfamily N-acetyltransferase
MDAERHRPTPSLRLPSGPARAHPWIGVVERLAARHRGAFRAHLACLADHDLYLRFGAHRTPALLDAYVAGIDCTESAVFGVFGDARELVGAAHVGRAGDDVELGLSVLASHRRRGIGALLFAAALRHARGAGAQRLCIHALAENEPMLRLARAARVRVRVAAGEAVGQVEIG